MEFWNNKQGEEHVNYILINTHSLVSKGRRLDAQLKKMVCFQKVATKSINHVRSYNFALSWLARDSIWGEGGGSWGGTN